LLHQALRTSFGRTGFPDEKVGATLEIGAAITGDEAHNPGEKHRSDNGNYDADDQTVLSDSPESEKAGQEPADERAGEADNHVHDEAKARPLHQFSSDPAGEYADDDPRNNSMTHVIVLLLGLNTSPFDETDLRPHIIALFRAINQILVFHSSFVLSHRQWAGFDRPNLDLYHLGLSGTPAIPLTIQPAEGSNLSLS
jgi:hypothetical protein